MDGGSLRLLLLLRLLLRRIVATDTNTVDDCLHLADYIRGGDRVGVGGGLGGGGEEEEADGGATLLRWRGRGRTSEGGRKEGKWMEDPKEEEEWAAERKARIGKSPDRNISNPKSQPSQLNVMEGY